MYQIPQNAPQDSIVKQAVQHDSLADSLKITADVKSIRAQPTITLPAEQAQLPTADSVPQGDTVLAETPTVSLFTAHELKPLNPGPLQNPHLYSGWITFLLLSSVVVIAYLRVAYPKRFTEFFRAVSDMRFASQLVREEKVLSQRVSVFLTVVFFFTSSAFLYFVGGYFNVELFSGGGFLVFVKLFLSVFLLFLLRIFIVELAGVIFNAQYEFSFYNFHVFLFIKALGLALIPVVAGIVYGDAFPHGFFIYTGIVFCVISYIAMLTRGLNIGMAKQGFNKFYLFFYFCTLEILPVVVLAKIILKHTA